MQPWAEVREHKRLGGEAGFYLLRLRAPEVAAQARPGQFIMLRTDQGLDPLLARPFSIHGGAGPDILILYQAVGKGTRLLSRIAPGEKLALWGPLGRGFDLDSPDLVLAAGGMGVAPLAFAAQVLAERGARARFLWGLPGAQGHAELNEHSKAHDVAGAAALSLSSEDGSLGSKGLVTALLEREAPGCGGVLACGPMPMLKAAAALCTRVGAPCQASLAAPMACGVGACLGCAVPAAGGGYLRVCQEGPVLPAEKVDWSRV